MTTKARLLAQLPLFEGMPRQHLQLLAKMTEELDFSAGKVLCREGRVARNFFVVLEGEAEVTTGGVPVRRLRAGDFFGEVAAFERSPCATTVTALTPLRFFVFASKAFWSLIAQSPRIESRLLRALLAENITVRELIEAALRRQAQVNEHQALHDGLTGLPNRTLFRDRIERGIRHTNEHGGRFAVLVMDVDRFKEVNDTLGHHAGDLLLDELGARLQNALRTSDTVARLGGDEFGILLPDQGDSLGVAPAMDKIREAVERPIRLQDLSLGVEASIGVAYYPDDGHDVETLLQRADVAMYRAKDSHAFYACYDPTTDVHRPERLTIVAELRRALDAGHLTLHYQPKATLASGAVASVEALLRWFHPERGLIPPDTFIPAVQHTGLIKPLTLFVVEEALRQCRAWQDEGLELAVAVNLSTRNLLDTAFPDDVQRLLDRHGIEPRLLKLEITESAMLADAVRTRQVLERLSAMGLEIALDDFGTGYSSLAHLTSVPLDELKIDRSFVSRLLEDGHHAAIVRSTINLARNLGLGVVAEGVETEDVWRALSTLGCDLAQGFFLAKPLPADELAAWVRDRGEAAGAVRPAAA